MLWGGTKQKLQWLPEPAPGVRRRFVQSVQAGTLDRGGGYLSRSTGGHWEWDFDFPVSEAHGGLDVFAEYASGLHNDFANLTDGDNPNDLFWWVDPMDQDANLFPPGWASPALCLSGDWPPMGIVQSHAATPANSNGLPSRQVVFSVTTAANTHDRTILIPIPPGFTLRWGVRGARTGTGVMRAVAHHKTGGADLTQSVTPVAVTDTTRVGNSISGDTYDYVTIGLARTSTAASTVTVAGMVAQLHSGTAPAATGPHIAGRGHTGCVFKDDAVAEDYYLAAGGRHLKGLSFGMKEVGGWR